MVRTHVIAAAARAALPLLNGPVRDAVVLGAFSRAVIISFPTPDGPRVLSLLAPGAAGVPNGVRLNGDDEWILGRQTPGEAVSVGAGRIVLGGAEVRVVRTWPCRVRQFTAGHLRVAAISEVIRGRAASQQPGVSGHVVLAVDAALEPALESPVASAAADDPLAVAVRRLVGRGLGLTPGGDDVIAGALCGLHATRAFALARLLAAAALDDVTERTTLLSADLLRLAATGDACLEVLGVLRAAHHPPDVLQPSQSPLAVAIDRLLRVGHTSGADLATGLAIGLRAGARARARAGAGVGAEVG